MLCLPIPLNMTLLYNSADPQKVALPAGRPVQPWRTCVPLRTFRMSFSLPAGEKDVRRRARTPTGRVDRKSCKSSAEWRVGWDLQLPRVSGAVADDQAEGVLGLLGIVVFLADQHALLDPRS